MITDKIFSFRLCTDRRSRVGYPLVSSIFNSVEILFQLSLLMRTVNALKFSELQIDTVFLLLVIYLIINIRLLEAVNSQPKNSFKKNNERAPSWGQALKTNGVGMGSQG